MPEEVLATERAYFAEIKPHLLESSENKFVLIKGRELIGTFDTAEHAYAAGINRLGNVDMLIVQVLRQEPRSNVPALSLGLIRATVP